MADAARFGEAAKTTLGCEKVAGHHPKCGKGEKRMATMEMEQQFRSGAPQGKSRHVGFCLDSMTSETERELREAREQLR